MAESNLSINLNEKAVLEIVDSIINIMSKIYGEDLNVSKDNKQAAFFREMFGIALPANENMDDPAYRKYLVFKRVTLSDHKKKVVEAIRTIRPDIAIARNTIDGTGLQRMESNTEIDRPLPHWQYSASDNTKTCVTSWPGSVSSNSSVDFIGFFYRHVAVSPHQQELRLWQNLAHCGALDYYLIGRLDNHRDRSGYESVRKVFAFHKKHFDDTYRGLRPVSNVLLVAGGGDVNEYRGWFRLLSEGHFLFDVVELDRIQSLQLETYDCVVLPNSRFMRDDAANELDRYVDGGGTIVATGETGFYDDSYERRSKCVLRSLGIREIKAVRNDMRSALLEVNDKANFPSLVERDLLYFGDMFVFADYGEEATGHLRLIPPHNYGPPERCYWEIETDIPGLLDHPYGKGKAIYLPWLPGGLFFREGHDNTPVFIHDMLKVLSGIKGIEGTLSPMVEASMAVSPDHAFMLLQLVNGSGHFGNTFYGPVKMHDITIDVPIGSKPTQTLQLSNVSPVPMIYDSQKKRATLDLSELKFYEAIKILL